MSRHPLPGGPARQRGGSERAGRPEGGNSPAQPLQAGATGLDSVILHEVAFDARPELKNMLVDDGKAAIEADFVGVHIGEFADVAATHNNVRVPYSVIYDLDGNRIKALRIYMPLQELLAQLGAPAASAQTGAHA